MKMYALLGLILGGILSGVPCTAAESHLAAGSIQKLRKR